MIKTFLKGLFMGTADIIPGVSGGTIALITGIYERLISGIADVADLVKPKNWTFDKVKKIDWNLFIPLGLGIALAFILLSNVIHYLLENYVAYTYAFFFGLILASAWLVYKGLEKFSGVNYISGLIGIIFGSVVVGLPGLGASHSLPILFFSGAIAITAMILPGISGAFILLLLNQYEYVVNIIRTLNISEGAIFGLGAVTGLLFFSEFLRYLLKNHRNNTMGFLVGIMLGSLRLPAGNVIANPGNILMIIISGIIGILIIFMVEKTSEDK